MELITEELLKDQAIAIDEDMPLLRHYGEAAERYFLQVTRRSASELMDDNGPYADVAQAIIMLAAHWYNQREAVAAGSQQTTPLGFASIAKRYRQYAPLV